ncbi:MAG: hypothetical protein NVSMB49_18180 [Ktedonobacteraceae bacterium]
MQRNVVRSLFMSVAALVLVSLSVTALHETIAHADMHSIKLNAQMVPLVQHAQLLQAVDTSQQAQLAIGLQLRNGTNIDSFLNALYDPQSPQYHHYLTPDQFTQLFAPTPDQVQQVTSYLQNQGFTITNIAPNNLIIDATGSIGQAQQSFHVQINRYQLGNHTFYANDAPPSLPASIGSLISSISGLDNSTQYHPLYHRMLHTAQAGPIGGLGPKDLATAYDATPLQSSGMLGDNQTIGLFELDGYQANDVRQYFQNYGITPPNLSTVLVDGFNGNAGQGAIEAELDIEIAGGIAPHANQIVYEGPNTTPGLNDTYNKIVTDNKVQIASISWGLCENSSGSAELQTLDTIFKQGAAQGISFIAAAGDAGAYDCQDTNLNVDSPADDPYVTGVGATSLQTNNGAYGSESVWSDPTQIQRGPKGSGSGGGLSTQFKQPSWQSGPGVQNKYSNGYREVPDVSAAGDPKPGYSVYCTVTNAGCPPTGWLTIGGTSAAAPFWASSLLLVNQYVRTHNAGVIGHVNPALYHLFNTQQQYPAFHDVTTGNNLFFPATPGYDLASGIGSPDVYNIARDLTAPSASGGSTAPTATPTLTPSPTLAPTDTPQPTPSPTQIPSLIQNGGFENGQDPWQQHSSQGNPIIDPSNPNTGQFSAYLCGYPGCDDRIWQTFTVPTAYTRITLTYWWYSDTNKTTQQCQDTFSTKLQTPNGGQVRTLQQSCNTNATNTWVQQSYDVTSTLSAFKGKQITLIFRGTNVQGQYQTSDFFVDDVAMTVN